MKEQHLYKTTHCTKEEDTVNINTGEAYKKCTKKYTPDILDIVRHGRNDQKNAPEKREKLLENIEGLITHLIEEALKSISR